MFCLADGGELRDAVAVEEDDRGLEQVLHRRRWRDRRPARSAGSSSRARPTPTRLRMSSGSLFQSLTGRWRSLLIRTGARPLARNNSAKLVATSSFSSGGPAPEPGELVLVVDQLLGAQAIPVVACRRSACRRAGRPAPAHKGSRTSTAGRGRNSRLTWKLLASQSIPRSRLRLSAPCRSCGSSRPGGIPAPGTAASRR